MSNTQNVSAHVYIYSLILLSLYYTVSPHFILCHNANAFHQSFLDIKVVFYSQRLPEILHAKYECRHYYLRPLKILYAIYKCRRYCLRLPEVLYAIFKYRHYCLYKVVFSVL